MDEITKTGIQFITKDIKEQFIGDAQFLMESAIKFIQKLENMINEYNHLQKNIRLYRDKSLAALKEEMHRSNTRLKQIIEAQYIFEAQVNAFLGRKINFVWVDVNTGEAFFVDEAEASQIYQMAKKGSQPRSYGNIKIKNQENFKNRIQKLPSGIEETYKNELNKRIQGHQALFQVIMQRFDDNTKKEDNPWYEEHKKTVYWKHPPEGPDNFHHPKWSWSITTAKGFISQGYINFLVNSIQKMTETSEFNIGTFMTTFVQQGDRIPGIVKGDIVVENSSGKVHVAVKSNTLFSTAGIGPYITTAFSIISFYEKLEELTIDQVKKILNNLENYNISLLMKSQEAAADILEKIFKQTGATVL